MLTPELYQHINELLSVKNERSVVIQNITTLTGGSINKSYCLKTTAGNYFLKYNDAHRFPGMFNSEAKGLALLRSKKVIGIPQGIDAGEIAGYSFILMEMLSSSPREKNYNKILGQQLAALHKIQSSGFGLDHDNYIGSLYQNNSQNTTGHDFLIQCRFIPMVQAAIALSALDNQTASKFESLYNKLPDLLPKEQPSLLHGDLWSGNVITGPDNKAWLIDPAVYFGYRETDLAMMKLFGGFDDEVFLRYNENFPLSSGWKDRIQLFQLYPLLVHLNLFGRSYLPAIQSCLSCYL